MFQKPVHDAAHRDVFTQTRHARTEAADAANDEFDFHARLGRGVKRLDQLRFHERVEFGDEAGRQSPLRIGRFARDELQEPGVQVKRGHDEFFHALGDAHAFSQAWWEEQAQTYMLEHKDAPRLNSGLWSRSMAARFPKNYSERVKQEITGANGTPLTAIEVIFKNPDGSEAT